jgi:hypothetical protein
VFCDEFRALNIVAPSITIILSWYTPDFPDRIRPLKEEDFAKIARAIKTHEWGKEQREFLREMLDYLTKA